MKLIYALVLITWLTACASEEIQTAGQINAAKISEQMSRYKVNNLVVFEEYNNSYYVRYEGSDFRIDGQFLVVDNSEYWNLDRMISFTSGSRSMTIYFR